jgi:RNA methyltransferase, TrmH family
MGSLFYQPIRTEVDLAQIIRDWPGDSVATVAHRGELLRNNPPLKKPVLLVLGHETRGLTPEIAALCTQRLTLNPMGHAESLNLVTAAAVFAYALT